MADKPNISLPRLGNVTDEDLARLYRVFQTANFPEFLSREELIHCLIILAYGYSPSIETMQQNLGIAAMVAQTAEPVNSYPDRTAKPADIASGKAAADEFLSRILPRGGQ